jgi:hypothetical protein
LLFGSQASAPSSLVFCSRERMTRWKARCSSSKVASSRETMKRRGAQSGCRAFSWVCSAQECDSSRVTNHR